MTRHRFTSSFRLAAALLACLAAATPAHADRSDDLTALARVFGELHHVRRICEPRAESELWRERMKQMVRLEQPTAKLRQRLVGAFNDGFRSAETIYYECDDAAEDFARARASVGRSIVSTLAQ